MAHLLEHMVFKGTPTTSATSARRSIRRGMRYQRHHLRSTAPTTSRRCTRRRREPRVGARAGSRPHGQQLHRPQGPRHRDDRRPQRVRARREQPARILCQRMHRLGLSSGTTTASPPSATAPTSSACHRQPAGLLRKYYQPDNAVLIVAGKFDEAKTLGWIAKYFGAIPKPTRTLPRMYTRGAGAGRRAHRHAAPRRRRAARRRRSTTVPGAHPDSAAVECSATS